VLTDEDNTHLSAAPAFAEQDSKLIQEHLLHPDKPKPESSWRMNVTIFSLLTWMVTLLALSALWSFDSSQVHRVIEDGPCLLHPGLISWSHADDLQRALTHSSSFPPCVGTPVGQVGLLLLSATGAESSRAALGAVSWMDLITPMLRGGRRAALRLRTSI
jgi:hypothetical protein